MDMNESIFWSVPFSEIYYYIYIDLFIISVMLCYVSQMHGHPVFVVICCYCQFSLAVSQGDPAPHINHSCKCQITWLKKHPAREQNAALVSIPASQILLLKTLCFFSQTLQTRTAAHEDDWALMLTATSRVNKSKALISYFILFSV